MCCYLLDRSQFLLSMVVLASVLAMTGKLSAQGTPYTSDSKSTKHYTSQTAFKLPIRIDDGAKTTLREVLLLVKAGNDKWKQVESAAPTQQWFRYTVPTDGEYWFTLVTVDNQGTCSPKDAEHITEQDIVKVVVDTVPPTFDLKVVKLPSGDQALCCEISDSNPDYSTVRIAYTGSNKVEQSLESIQPGLFRVPSPEVFAMPLQVSMADRAKNSVSKTIKLSESVAKTQPEATVQVKQEVATIQGRPPEKTVVPAIFPADSAAEPVAHSVSPAKENLEPGTVQRQIINTTRASLDYQIDRVGPSGVGKVEVWITSDQGATWRRHAEDTDKHSPAEFDLPGDGTYGLRVAVTNGNGFGGRAPVSGDQPQVWIEVDTIAPAVHLKEIDSVTNGGPLEIQWTATDKNLATNGVNLYYAVQREGPWQPIARGVKNDGHYKWNFPSDQGGQFFIRVEAIDQAGNVAKSESTNAVVLDMTEPHATVVGVTGIPSQPAPFPR